MHAVLNRETVVRLRVDDEGGNLIPADGTPTLTVETADGDPVTPGAVAAEATGLYASTIPAQVAVTDLVANWSYAVSGSNRSRRQVVRVVSERLVEPWRLREDTELATLSNVAIIQLMDVVQDWFRDALKFPVAEEYFTRTFRVRNQTSELLIPDTPFPVSIAAVKVDQTVFTSDEIADLQIVGGTVERGISADPFLTGGWPGGCRHAWAPGLYTVTGTHGPRDDWQELPEDLRRAAGILARYVSRKSNYPERARAVATDGAQIVLSTPSADRPTGLPDVDGVVGRYRLTVVV